MRWAPLCVAAVLAACNSSSSPTANASQAASLDEAAAAASDAADQYGGAAGAATNQADCMAALQHYVGTMQPLVDQMRSLAAPMDGYMRSAGDAMAGDMECGVQVMEDELGQHRAVACTSPDMAVNHAEAQRHVAAMLSFADHMKMRSVQAGGMMSQGGMMGGGQGMMDAGWMSGWTDAGWTMPDGGMMDYDHPMPGCTYSGGAYQAPDGGYWADGGWMMDGGSGNGSMMDGGAMMGGGPSMMPGGMR